MHTRHLLLAMLLLTVAHAASAACVNKFVSRTERPRQVVTLLTGKLTFQEAQALAAAIEARKAPPIEWLDTAGKVLSRQFGPLKVIRPMPVGCDGRASGVVMIATFPSNAAPTKSMVLRLTPQSTVTFELQN